MTGPRTLTTARIRDLYSWACAWRTEDDATEGESDLSGMRTSQRAEFDRWLAAHEAEVVGHVLDRIDALHPRLAIYLLADECGHDPGEDDTHESEQGDLLCLDSPTGEYVCGDCFHPDGEAVDFPCPTRRLTAEIRGEMSND